MSSYYYDPKVTRAEKEEQDADLRGKIEQVRAIHPRAGYRPMIRYLKKQGVFIGESRLRRVFKKFKLQIRPLKKFINTTDSNHSNFIYPNLLPEMVVDGPDQVWASDITYIRIDSDLYFWQLLLIYFQEKL